MLKHAAESAAESAIVLQDAEDLVVRDTSDPYKVAGAIAGRLRDGERVGLLTKGPEGVFISVQVRL